MAPETMLDSGRYPKEVGATPSNPFLLILAHEEGPKESMGSV